jgi:CDGSH-type Zn-finger protein
LFVNQKTFKSKKNTMKNPFTKAKVPTLVTLEPGPIAWCSCGKSSKQPFCDGTHVGTKFMPVFFKVTEKREAWLCQCKQTKNAPYCDGTHKTI